jgi:hypothetical protein
MDTFKAYDDEFNVILSQLESLLKSNNSGKKNTNEHNEIVQIENMLQQAQQLLV